MEMTLIPGVNVPANVISIMFPHIKAHGGMSVGSPPVHHHVEQIGSLSTMLHDHSDLYAHPEPYTEDHPHMVGGFIPDPVTTPAAPAPRSPIDDPADRWTVPTRISPFPAPGGNMGSLLLGLGAIGTRIGIRAIFMAAARAATSRTAMIGGLAAVGVPALWSEVNNIFETDPSFLNLEVESQEAATTFSKAIADAIDSGVISAPKSFTDRNGINQVPQNLIIQAQPFNGMWGYFAHRVYHGPYIKAVIAGQKTREFRSGRGSVGQARRKR